MMQKRTYHVINKQLVAMPVEVGTRTRKQYTRSRISRKQYYKAMKEASNAST